MISCINFFSTPSAENIFAVSVFLRVRASPMALWRSAESTSVSFMAQSIADPKGLSTVLSVDSLRLRFFEPSILAGLGESGVKPTSAIRFLCMKNKFQIAESEVYAAEIVCWFATHFWSRNKTGEQIDKCWYSLWCDLWSQYTIPRRNVLICKIHRRVFYCREREKIDEWCFDWCRISHTRSAPYTLVPLAVHCRILRSPFKLLSEKINNKRGSVEVLRVLPRIWTHRYL